MESSGYRKNLRAARGKSGKSPEEIAEALGISVAAYHDLESFDDELTTALPLEKVALLFKTLGVEPAVFFTASPEAKAVSVDTFVRKINEYLKTQQLTVSEFEDRVGWDIEPLLNEPSKILSYDIGAVKDIAKEIGIDWLSVLKSISSASGTVNE